MAPHERAARGLGELAAHGDARGAVVEGVVDRGLAGCWWARASSSLHADTVPGAVHAARRRLAQKISRRLDVYDGELTR